jgi:3-hydroxyisobutyrate dehydrogenase-like beta-hydroxyacid dehydrogenase
MLEATYSSLQAMSTAPHACNLASCHVSCQVASSPADVARQSDITFAMLSDPPAAVQVAIGPAGIVEGEQQGMNGQPDEVDD